LWFEFIVQLWASGGGSHWMLKIIEHFSKNCIFCLQSEYVMVGRFWQPSVGQTVGDELHLMMLISGPERQAAIQLEMSM
jgi:hypothetical protein